MDKHRSFLTKNIIGISAALVGVALLAGPAVRAQQPPKLTPPYAKAALLSLLAIESDVSTPHDASSETAEMRATQIQINAADAGATTKQEESITKMLRQIYQLRLQDNDLLRAYRKLAEIENAEDSSDQAVTKKQKDYAASQLADNEAAVEKREQTCFAPLEASLRQRSLQNLEACSEWIRKSKISERNPDKLETVEEGNPEKP
jgi:hypothetical protein